jgi:RNA polymerase sigma-70 factor, ECF subfamily
MPFPAGERLFRKREVLAAAAPCLSAEDADAGRLSAAVARGDEAAFRELYDRYHDRLFRLARALGRGDDSLAHETVQAVMLTAAAKLKSLTSEAHLWNWLAQVARQKVAKARRQADRNSIVVNVSELPEPAAPPDTILENRLDAALLTLDEADRRLVESFYFDGLTQKELAEQLGATPKAVSGRLERARAKLRAWLGGEDAREV